MNGVPALADPRTRPGGFPIEWHSPQGKRDVVVWLLHLTISMATTPRGTRAMVDNRVTRTGTAPAHLNLPHQHPPGVTGRAGCPELPRKEAALIFTSPVRLD